MSAKSPTLREVAEAAGVHTTTVSRALRGHPRVSASRAKELRELAERMGYVPDPMLSALASYRTSRRPPAFHSVIAWLDPTPEALNVKKWRTRRACLDGACERASQLGFQLEEMKVPLDEAMGRRMVVALNARNISGVIIAPTPVLNERWLRFIDLKGHSVVRIGESLSDAPFHVIMANRTRDMLQLMSELTRRGYRRPGLFIAEHMDLSAKGMWVAAYLRAQLFLPVKNRVAPFIFAEEKADMGKLVSWVRKVKPDVIIAIGEHALIPALSASGISVPQDMGLAVLMQPNSGNLLTGFDENSRVIGSAAIDWVVAMINRQERGFPTDEHVQLISSRWIESGSLREVTTQ